MVPPIFVQGGELRLVLPRQGTRRSPVFVQAESYGNPRNFKWRYVLPGPGAMLPHFVHENKAQRAKRF